MIHFSNSAYPLTLLAQELLVHTLSYLSSSQDISNLSRTCKVLHAKTIGHLYKYVGIKWKDSEPTRPLMVDCQDFAQSLRLNLLLQTLLVEPEYAQLIASLEPQSTGFETYWSSWGTSRRRRRPLDKPEPDVAPAWTMAKQRLVVDAVRNIGLEEQRDEHGHAFAVSDQSWCDAIFMYDLDATIALLIWVCPNLAPLHLGFHVGDEVVFLPRLLWKVPSIEGAKQAPGCEKLRKISLGYMHVADEDKEQSDM